MHQYGVLTAYLPQWRNIVGLMQFDLFHCYTVDEHILRVMLKLESFLSKNLPRHIRFAIKYLAKFPTHFALHRCVISHDIAKGRGALMKYLVLLMCQSLPCYGFDQREAETMAWLVEQHLLMSVTAQRRDT